MLGKVTQFQWPSIPSGVYWAALSACLAAIFVLSAQTTLTTSQPWMYEPLIRKPVHALEFAVLTLVTHVAMAQFKSRALWSQWVARRQSSIAFLLPLLYAISDETHQYFVPHRKGRVKDVLYDTCGILLALALISLWKRRKATRARVSQWLRRQPAAVPARLRLQTVVTEQ